MAKALERQVTRDRQISTVKGFITKFNDLPVAEKDLASLSRLTDATLRLLSDAIANPVLATLKNNYRHGNAPPQT